MSNLLKYKREYERVKPIEARAIESQKVASESEAIAQDLSEKLEKVLTKKRLVEARYEDSRAKKEAVEREQAILTIDRSQLCRKGTNVQAKLVDARAKPQRYVEAGLVPSLPQE